MSGIHSANLLGSLQVGTRGLLAQQSALNTIGHNLANASTPGYSRQRTELVASAPQSGVDVASVQRLRDRFLDMSLLNEQQALGRNEAELAMLQRLQGVVNDPPGTGLSAILDQFYQSFQDLSVDPTDQALRTTVADQGNRLATAFQGMSARIDQLETDLTTEIQNRVGDANSLLSQIAEVHGQLIASGPSGGASDLLDRRDQLVSQLSQIIGVSASDRPDGTVQLAISGTGILIVDGTSTAQLRAAVNPLTDTVELTAGTVTTPITPAGGAIAAALTARNSPTGAVRQAAADLDALARAIIAETNRIQTSGTGLTEHTSLTAFNAVSSAATPLTAAGLAFTPTTGSFKVIVHDAAGAVTASSTVSVTAGVTTLNNVVTALNAVSGLTASVSSGRLTVSAAGGQTFTFAADASGALGALGLGTFFTGSDAHGIALDPLVAGDVSKIAAAQADPAGLVHPGDGSNALLMAQLRTKPTLAAGSTFTDFYGTLVARVGGLTRDAAAAVDRQQASVDVVSSLQQQASGVSIDEEMINLTQAQTAYAASARYISTIQTMLDTLLQIAR